MVPWDLIKVLRELKLNKSRDPHGLINEIFKPGVIGNDLQNSILILMNKVKAQTAIPEFMEFANIVSIYKGRGEKSSLENDRGIFLVNVLRNILMKLVYNDNYKIVDESMSDSQVGARRNKNIRNHIFLLNGMINEAMQSKRNIEILIYDYRQCFDSLWLEECINDLFDAGIQNDHLPLIFEANKTNQVAVKTPFGLTNRKSVERIVMQGEVFGPLQCSVQVDTLAKECIDENKFLYLYKNEVSVPPLSMIDDLVCVAESGVAAVEVNSYINTKTAIKKLQFGAKKCHQMSVKEKEHICPELFIDNWQVEQAEFSGEIEDVYKGEINLSKTDAEKYLGDIICKDGKNLKNIKDRK